MTTTESKASHCGEGAGGILLALFLILTGFVILLRNFGVVWIDRVWDIWPLALIAAGLAGLIDWRLKAAA